MYKIFVKVINFMLEAMKNWKGKLVAGGKTFAKVKIQWGIFNADAISPLLFLINMIPLNHMLRKCTRVYKFAK